MAYFLVFIAFPRQICGDLHPYPAKLGRQITSVTTTMENTCTMCGHEHKMDGTCDCGCGSAPAASEATDAPAA